MKQQGGNTDGYLPKEYYLKNIQNLSGISQIKITTLKKLSSKQLNELIFLLENARIQAVDEYIENKEKVIYGD